MTLFTLHRGSTSENTRIILNCGPHTLETRAPQPWCAIWSSVGSATPEIKQPDSAKGTPIATGMSSYDDLALLLHLVGMPAARGRRASSFCTQHAKSFAPWLPAPERGIFAHSGSGALGPAEYALVRASHAWGNSQFSQPTFRPTNNSCTNHHNHTVKHRRNTPNTCTVSDHAVRRNGLLLSVPHAPGGDGYAHPG
jgi:hypothetical protein